MEWAGRCASRVHPRLLATRLPSPLALPARVGDKLSELFKKDRKEFEKKWDDIGIFVKYGMISEEKFYEKAKDFALLKNVDNQYFTLDEYKEKAKVNQEDKDQGLVYIYT